MQYKIGSILKSQYHLQRGRCRWFWSKILLQWKLMRSMQPRQGLLRVYAWIQGGSMAKEILLTCSPVGASEGFSLGWGGWLCLWVSGFSASSQDTLICNRPVVLYRCWFVVVVSTIFCMARLLTNVSPERTPLITLGCSAHAYSLGKPVIEE